MGCIIILSPEDVHRIYEKHLIAARLRHIAGTAWPSKRCLKIELPKEQQMRAAITT